LHFGVGIDRSCTARFEDEGDTERQRLTNLSHTVSLVLVKRFAVEVDPRQPLRRESHDALQEL
jgi:hypothetical protein